MSRSILVSVSAALLCVFVGAWAWAEASSPAHLDTPAPAPATADSPSGSTSRMERLRLQASTERDGQVAMGSVAVDTVRAPAKKRCWLTPEVVREHMDLILSALREKKAGLIESCFVELRQGHIEGLPDGLDASERLRAIDAIDAFVEAEYRFRLSKNEALIEEFVWGVPPSGHGAPLRGGGFLGEFGSLHVGSVEFLYVLDFDDSPGLTKAHYRREDARKALGKFLAR